MEKTTKLYQVFNRKTKKWHIMKEDPDHLGGRRFIRVQDEPEPEAEDITSETLRRDLIDPNGDSLKDPEPVQDQATDQEQEPEPEEIRDKWPWE